MGKMVIKWEDLKVECWSRVIIIYILFCYVKFVYYFCKYEVIIMVVFFMELVVF